MTRSSAQLIAIFGLAASFIGFPPLLFAAEVTDVVDALDEAFDDPFDFHFEPTFRQHIENGTIIREANCSPTDNGTSAFANAERCTDAAAIIYNRELDYERVINELAFEFQFGIWHDLEFHFNLPIIFHDQRTVSFATGDPDEQVTHDNSSIDPLGSLIEDDLADEGIFESYRYFGLDSVGTGPSRSGLGDISFGIAWAPYNDERNPHWATLVVGFDYQIPTSESATRTNTGPGRGVHELQFTVAASRRFSVVEPYVQLRYILPLIGSDSVFQDFGGGMVNQGPGQSGELSAGTEFIVYENHERGQHFSVDLGLDFAFTAEGRDYSPLTDAFAGSDCNGLTPADADFSQEGRLYEPSPDTDPESAGCAWILQQPANERRNPAAETADQQYYSDGISTVESYASLGGHIGVNVQLSEYVEVRIQSYFETQTEHFLTAAHTGVDRDNDNEVNLSDPNETNPVYNPTLDSVGERLRADSVFNVSWSATLAFQF